MLRMKIRIAGLQLQTARTEINNKQKKKEKIFFIFSAKRPVFETKQNRGNYVAENSFLFLQHSLNPLRVFSSLFQKSKFSKHAEK